MVLYIDSGTACLIILKAKSRIARYYFISDHLNKTNQLRLNKVILVEYKVLKNVVSFLVEIEIARVYHNTEVAISI